MKVGWCFLIAGALRLKIHLSKGGFLSHGRVLIIFLRNRYAIGEVVQMKSPLPHPPGDMESREPSRGQATGRAHANSLLVRLQVRDIALLSPPTLRTTPPCTRALPIRCAAHGPERRPAPGRGQCVFG